MIIIDAGYFCAGAVIENGVVTRVAPIIKYMRGWPIEKCIKYCVSKRWKHIIL
jgi:hypothetical protein